MSSQINPNDIDGNYPVSGQDNSSQGFRDNFTNTKTNFQIAADEITELQNKAIFKSALVGEVLDNDMESNLIYNALIRDFASSKQSLSTVAGVTTINYSLGHYQTLSTTTATTLAFSNWPATGTWGYVRVQIHVNNVGHTITLPVEVRLGLSGIQGISPGTAGVTNTITFGSTGYYEFAFGSYDAGTTITLFDLNRALTNFTFATLDLENISASGNIIAGGSLVGDVISSNGNITSVNSVNSGASVSAVGNVIGGNIVTSGAVTTTGSVVGSVLTGTVKPITGTLTTVPLQFQSGSLLVTPVDGAMEYDGTVIYATPTAGSSASQRGVVSTNHIVLTSSGGYELTQDTSVQNVFDSPNTIQLSEDCTYEFEAMYIISNDNDPSDSHSVSLLFDVSGTLTSFSYIADVSSSDGSPVAGAASITRNYGSAVTALQITPSSTTTSNEVLAITLRGIVRCSTSSTFTPQIQYNDNAPGGTSTVLENSYFRIAPLGTASMTSVGNWS